MPYPSSFILYIYIKHFIHLHDTNIIDLSNHNVMASVVASQLQFTNGQIKDVVRSLFIYTCHLYIFHSQSSSATYKTLCSVAFYHFTIIVSNYFPCMYQIVLKQSVCWLLIMIIELWLSAIFCQIHIARLIYNVAYQSGHTVIQDFHYSH